LDAEAFDVLALILFGGDRAAFERSVTAKPPDPLLEGELYHFQTFE